jgi:hypothetical protein
MRSVNGEAPATCDSWGFSISNPCEKTNMKIVANTDLNFHGVILTPVNDALDT